MGLLRALQSLNRVYDLVQIALNRLQVEAYLADFGLYFIFFWIVSVAHRVVYMLVNAILEVIVIILL